MHFHELGMKMIEIQVKNVRGLTYALHLSNLKNKNNFRYFEKNSKYLEGIMAI